MVEKRTDRIQIQEFASRGVDIFDSIEQNIQVLVEKAANVNYQGPNARAFKTACVNHAIDFAEQTTKTMGQMNDAIQTNTTFIATALGGQPISLDPPQVAIQPPAINIDESIEQADDVALHQLRDDTESIFATVTSLFDENLTNFNKLGVDGWYGPEYDNTRDALTRLTGTAVDGCNQSRTAMVKDVQTQIDILF
ncbi:MAG: hypothetical protein F4010_00765 [Cenarchaeum sp. SB0669_bin_11]|nr:hypothetical protein [Acidimicrobiia bacterium]MYL10694.1 hypothetical protein [Cenarchaeum sp. SB0669_bin_11]